MAIESIESLREHAQWWLMVEHATIPPYLCALYSIKEGHNIEAREVLESVFMEEMLHMTLAANVINAIGGKPELDIPGFLPTYPTCLPHSSESFEVSLLKCSQESLALFLLIEKPEAHGRLPQDENYDTIGQFLEAIEDGLVRLCDELGEENVFTGDPSRQVRPDAYYGGSGKLIAVEDLASALAALKETAEQGEGHQHQEIWDGDRNMFHPEREEIAHYYRFEQISKERYYRRGDNPQSGPTGEPFPIDWDAIYNMRPNPRAQDYPEGSDIREALDRFNRTYSSILHLLDLCFNGQPKILAIATGAMYELKQQAIDLMQMPSGDGETTVGPSFEYIPQSQRHPLSHLKKKIVVMANGPYLVYGDIPLVRKTKVRSEQGEALVWQKTEQLETEETYALCRCGRSTTKPFCDGTHARFGFDGTETIDSTNFAQRQEQFDGTGIVVKRDSTVCMHAGFCINKQTGIKKMVPDSDDIRVRVQLTGMIERCPSGSYVYAITPDGENVEPDLPEAIAVTEDSSSACSLWVTGGIPLERADGEPFETRNRYTLCRCGESARKPLCDGTHSKIGFKE